MNSETSSVKSRVVDPNIRAFIFIGRSGCGKGTQAKFLMDHLKSKTGKETLYIQTGAELRSFIKEDSYSANLVEMDYKSGGLQSEFVTVHMWARLLIRDFNGKQHIVFDGTPRKFHEAGVLDSVFSFYGFCSSDHSGHGECVMAKPAVIHIDISREEAVRRLSERGRMDDGLKDINKRLDWFESDVVPALKFYENNPRYDVIKIDGHATPEVIFADLLAKLSI